MANSAARTVIRERLIRQITSQVDKERRVIVIDDDDAVCRAISRMLGATGYEVRTYTRAREFLDEQEPIAAACLLVDIRMPDVDGLSLIRSIRSANRDIAILVMTAIAHIPTVVEVMREGAIDLLVKPFSATELDAAIARARESARRLQNHRAALVELWRLFEPITPREAEVCGLVASGLLNKQIGALIGTAEKTVKVHRGRVIAKLGVSSVAELVRLVDELRTSSGITSVDLDGENIVRPVAADIVIATSESVARERERTSLLRDHSMDQRAIPRLQ